MKFILLLGILLLVWLLFFKVRGGPRVDATRRDEPKQAVVAMTQCAHCGVHLPRNEAVLQGELAYCSPAHCVAGPHPP